MEKKIDVLDLLIAVLREHEKALDREISRLATMLKYYEADFNRSIDQHI